ncbi:hypothetical protein [Psychroserpens sp. NJDZ02]|uniref:hypothetical protein n=1 Tax=Psychroserpens sp. NJDZ02 TaxID=2570561 RepID=UPI0010A8DED0|nr:hypothetical protein [Psychroserpens sp. NJDZ02]QCE43152.1 hypothetical protein E9099_17575 [Psychroserpens sp. NJDZ02]
MNYLLKLSVAICLLFSVSSCSVDSLEDSTDERAINTTAVTPNVACSNQDPKSKLINNGTVVFTLQIFDSNNNLTELIDVAPGTSSSWISFSEGDTVFNLDSTSSNVSDDKISINMNNCSEVEIVVNALNKIDSPVVNSLD